MGTIPINLKIKPLARKAAPMVRDTMLTAILFSSRFDSKLRAFFYNSCSPYAGSSLNYSYLLFLGIGVVQVILIIIISQIFSLYWTPGIFFYLCNASEQLWCCKYAI